MRTRSEKKDSAIHELSDDDYRYLNLREYPTKQNRLKFENYLMKVRNKKKEKTSNKYVFNYTLPTFKKNIFYGESDFNLKNNKMIEYRNYIFNNIKN